MPDLLFKNIPEKYISATIQKLEKSDFDVDYLVLNKQEEITPDIIKNTSWDAIILAEKKSNNFSLLRSAVNNFPRTPIIFFAEEQSKKVFAEALKYGARDFVSASEIYRIPLILSREIVENHPSKSDQNVIGTQDLFYKILNRSREEIFLFDAHTLECRFSNSTAVKNMGYSRDELEQYQAFEIYSEYDSDSFTDLIAPLFERTQEQLLVCTNLTRKTGAVYPVEVHLSKINHQGTPYLLAINKDISTSWLKIQKLKRQRQLTNNYINQYKQTQELLANAAHDMRTSLQSIILSNKLLFNKQPDDFQTDFGTFQKAIHFSGKHLLNYINEFFDSHNGNDDLSSRRSDILDIESFAHKLYVVFKPIAQRNEISFHFDISSLQHSNISTNQTYIKRILKNLLANAFKFTNKGHITFKVNSVSVDKLSNIDFGTKHAIAFSVEDTGIGISQEEQDKVFERHKRTNNSKKGSGLGLHISQKLTKALGGVLSVESKVNKGSSFTLYLPVDENLIESPTDTQKASSPFQNGKSIYTKNKTILIVDDSEVHNLALKEYLLYTFDECITANTILKAQDIIENNEIDCIVSDYIIYEHSGLDFIRSVNENEHSAMPSIIYTGKKLSTAERDEILDHADAVLQKNNASYEKLVTIIISLFSEDNTQSVPFV